MLYIQEFRWFSLIKINSRISSIDAERHRRTPRLSAISGKMVDVWAAGFLRAVADSMRDAGRIFATLPLQYYQISEQKN